MIRTSCALGDRLLACWDEQESIAAFMRAHANLERKLRRDLLRGLRTLQREGERLAEEWFQARQRERARGRVWHSSAPQPPQELRP